MRLFGDNYSGRRVLVTGHTGFKGSWLSFWLKRLGAEVCGISLDPESQPNHYELLECVHQDNRVDIRDAERIKLIIEDFNPEIVFHLAAQPLVRRSYRDPLANWSTNVMGTANVLEACRSVKSLRAIIAITTDKVYANKEWAWGYRENDELGGHDPYSASKAACELLIGSYRNAFFHTEGAPLLASTRAGNVIGGGDWSEDRLIPDLVRAVEQGKALDIRSPHATRPWQHVLDCLAGYLHLGTRLLNGGQAFAQAWNFGPDIDSNKTVHEILHLMKVYWPGLEWTESPDLSMHEANFLYLDYAKARYELDWLPVWSITEACKHTAEWYREYLASGNAMTELQLSSYIDDAKRENAVWIDA